MTAVRLAAAQALLAIEQGRTTFAAEVDAARAGLEDSRDRGLLVTLAGGVLRWRNALDAVIETTSGRPKADIEPVALTTLRLGVFQLRYLDRVPAHAIVNESVEVVRALGAPRAAGFVNAVLRSLASGRPNALPPRPAHPNRDRPATLAYLSITLSHPAWLVERWLAREGFDAAEAWCQFNNRAPDVTVRTRGISPEDLRARLAESGITAERAEYVSQALRLPPGALGKIPAELHEYFSIQDEGSQLVASFVGARPGDRVLDVCAAPGGKTAIMAEAVLPGGWVVASDHRLQRVKLLDATLARLGVAPRIVRLDARAPLPFGETFDRVLVDVPCSGLGTLRRDPDLKWSRKETDLSRLATAAGQMLASAAVVVRPGGSLLYATCSSEPEENDGVVREFLAATSAFELALPASLGAEWRPLTNAAGMLVTRPARHGLDAFFAAVLVRRRNA